MKLSVDLPADIAKKFQEELTTLVAQLPELEGFKGAYLHEEFLSKYCDSTTTPPDVRRAAAIHKWKAAELRNASSNARIMLHDVDFGWTTSEKLFKDVRTVIRRILGPVVYPEILGFSVHTNGASTRIRRSSAASILKLAGEAHLSSSAVKHWLARASGTRLSDQCLQLNESSSLFTVPKKSDIDRVACKEPEINAVLQRSIGIHMRRRLRKVGIDLKDQTVNQRLAGEALNKGLATIDLSSASDSISRQLVFELLPFDWWSLLDDLRVKSTMVDGECHELEMFSSMGNGFTFELETLLFYAVTRVVCWRSGVRGRISVYGDDIIAPCRIVPRLKRVFDFLGFIMNPKKTNFRGTFRESCGRHYNRGFDVTPFYLRREVSTLVDVIHQLNQLMKWSCHGFGFIQDPTVARFHRKWSGIVPAFLHGGIDPMDSSALVTGDSPRKRLQLTQRELKVPQDVAYLYWFFAKETLDTPVEVDPRVEGRVKVARFKAYGCRTAWTPYFIHSGK